MKANDGAGRPSGSAAGTIANVQAVRAAYERAVEAGGPMTLDDICRTHAALATSDRHMAPFAGEVRTRQNWIGRDPYTPAGADFVPPPPRLLDGLLEDLCAFCSRRDISPLLQAAIAHAQFETIHPFADGNGRVGRTLIGELICRGGLARDVIPPTSLVLSGNRQAYVDALTAWRFEEDGRDRWIRMLAEAAHTAAAGSIRLADEIAALKLTWRERCAHRRRDSAAVALLEHLPAHPIITGAEAIRLTGRSGPAARGALNQLTEDGVLLRGDARQAQPRVGSRRAVRARRRARARLERRRDPCRDYAVALRAMQQRLGHDRSVALQLVVAMIVFMWALEAVDYVAPGAPLDNYGIHPRDAQGLPEILSAPFLHVGFGHSSRTPSRSR